MLSIQGLVAGYGDVEVLHGIDLYVGEGEIVALIGANSSGKSTMISCVSGINKIAKGKIIFEEKEIHNMSPDKIVDLGIIQIPEGRLLFPKLTVKENLELGAFNKRSRSSRAQALDLIYEFLPRLKEREKQVAGSLSGGEAQMCAIGRGLMSKPRLLILDEPSLGLAPILVPEIMRLIRKIRDEEGVTVLLVEQNVKQSLKLADRTYVLENGRVVAEGKSEELMNSEQVRKAYLGI
jgi:branched-chain amino acid transport system ATP-binding protein